MSRMTLKYWKQLERAFAGLYKDSSKIEGPFHIDFIRPTLVEAGKKLHEFMADSKGNDFGLGDEFKKEPVADSPKGKRTEYYSGYWLCILIILGRKNVIKLVNPKLRDYPAALLRGSTPFWQETMSDDCDLRRREWEKGYIQDICLGSQELCTVVAEALKPAIENWNRPEDTHFSVSAIVNDHKMPRTTLQGREKKALEKGEFTRSDIKEDPKTREKWFPQWWVLKTAAELKAQRKRKR